MAERGKAAKMLPEYKVFEKKYDKIRMIEEECPGVYYIFTEGLRNGSIGSEFYAVMRDTPVISAQAKSYGIPLSDASSAPSSQKADLGLERDFRRARQRTQAG